MRLNLSRFKPSDNTQWHLWFAWYPVKVGSTIIWLETILRRKRYHNRRDGQGTIISWVYMIDDIPQKETNQ